MGLLTGRDAGGEKIPAGEKIRFRIQSVQEDESIHGPQVKMSLEVLDPPYKGSTILEWASLAQPRTDFVRALRGKGYEDEKIAEILRDRGFTFDEIDEPEEEIGVSTGGKLYNISMACFHGKVEFIDALDSVDNLIEELAGRTFVAVTKDRGADNKYTGIVWDMVYVDPDPEEEEAADFNDIPF